MLQSGIGIDSRREPGPHNQFVLLWLSTGAQSLAKASIRHDI
jgi:hypothetical protein